MFTSILAQAKKTKTTSFHQWNLV